MERFLPGIKLHFHSAFERLGSRTFRRPGFSKIDDTGTCFCHTSTHQSTCHSLI